MTDNYIFFSASGDVQASIYVNPNEYDVDANCFVGKALKDIESKREELNRCKPNMTAINGEVNK